MLISSKILSLLYVVIYSGKVYNLSLKVQMAVEMVNVLALPKNSQVKQGLGQELPLFNEHRQFFIDNLSGVVTVYPFLFAVVLFFFSSIFFSHGATVRAIMPLGLTLGIAPSNLVAMLTATSGYFFIPTGGLTIACVAFDRTGTTKVGKWVLNHSFMRPGLITLIVSLAISFVLIQFVF